MNYSKIDSKNDTKLNPGHATVTVPSTPDTSKNNGPVPTGRDSNDAKPTVQAPGTPASSTKSNGADPKPGLQASGDAASEDKSDGASMVNEGGHAAPGRSQNAARESTSPTGADTHSGKRFTDNETGKPDLSAKSAR